VAYLGSGSSAEISLSISPSISVSDGLTGQHGRGSRGVRACRGNVRDHTAPLLARGGTQQRRTAAMSDLTDPMRAAEVSILLLIIIPPVWTAQVWWTSQQASIGQRGLTQNLLVGWAKWVPVAADCLPAQISHADLQPYVVPCSASSQGMTSSTQRGIRWNRVDSPGLDSQRQPALPVPYTVSHRPSTVQHPPSTK
jgi:hypothetical protein